MKVNVRFMQLCTPSLWVS